MVKRYPSIFFVLLIVAAGISPVISQEPVVSQEPGESGRTADESSDPPTLLRGFRDLQLGLSFSEAQAVLRRDSAFNYRGPEDVSLRLSDSRTVIDSPGRGFVDRVLLQFFDESLYIITLYLNRDRLDYFQVFNRMSARYGTPTELNPQMTRWEDAATRITVERPLQVQYLDLATFERVRDSARIEEAIQTELRQEFLDAF